MNPQLSPSQPTLPSLPTTPKKHFSWLAIVALIIIVIVAGLYIVANLFSGQASSIAPAQIIIDKSGFTPTTIKVQKGQPVTWVNQDKSAHKVVGDQSGSNFDSQEDLLTNDSFTFTFDSAGMYSYHDPLGAHNFTGIVIVE